MASAVETTLADLGEWTLIERLARFAPPGQFDDVARHRGQAERGDRAVDDVGDGRSQPGGQSRRTPRG